MNLIRFKRSDQTNLTRKIFLFSIVKDESAALERELSSSDLIYVEEQQKKCCLHCLDVFELSIWV